MEDRDAVSQEANGVAVTPEAVESVVESTTPAPEPAVESAGEPEPEQPEADVVIEDPVDGHELLMTAITVLHEGIDKLNAKLDAACKLLGVSFKTDAGRVMAIR